MALVWGLAEVNELSKLVVVQWCSPKSQLDPLYFRHRSGRTLLHRMLQCLPSTIYLNRIPTTANLLDNNPKCLTCYRWWYYHQAHPRTWMGRVNTPAGHLEKP